MDYTSIGKNIKKYRLERADKLPSLTALINLSNALEVTSDMLLGDLLNESYKIKNSLILDKIA